MDVASALRTVQQRIALAAETAGRSPSEVRLVCVSKMQAPEAIRAAYAEGARDFGENYAQELRDKARVLSDLPGLRWHMIGHLQRNKVRDVVGAASAVQSVDSLRLIDALAERAKPVPEARRFSASGRLCVFIEVNVAGEEQKTGCHPDELSELLARVEAAPALELSGLMTVPPYSDDPRGSRPSFDRLAELRAQHGGPERLPELSMGMSMDFEEAILAGATVVRVGTAIFGARE